VTADTPLRVVFRWQVPSPQDQDRERCYDCGVQLLLKKKETPRLRLQFVTQDQNQLVIRVEPLCWRCWKDYQSPS
jgi:DNA-directed RNA polymerase subunit RPC12/RpoP